MKYAQALHCVDVMAGLLKSGFFRGFAVGFLIGYIVAWFVVIPALPGV